MTPARKPARSTKPRKEWHLVCITRLGKVSMLRDMDLYTAREAYKRLKPDGHPEEHVFSKCKKCQCGSGHSYGSCGRSYGPTDDWLEKVEVIGPARQELDPWHGVAPRIIKHHCRCAERKAMIGMQRASGIAYQLDDEEDYEDDDIEGSEPAVAAALPRPRAPRWDRRRSDFWNYPRLWDRVKDTHRQMCWEMVR